ncbi:MAG: type II secretory pathway, component PulD, partial [Isosphaeraceae bacterium]
GRYDQAEVIAQEVASWNLSYGFREDTPRKIGAAARSLRQRDQVRHGKAKSLPSQDAYAVMIQEARQLLAAGQLDQAEAKAHQAHALGVTPALTVDRAENILHDVAMHRARTTPSTVAGLDPAQRPAPALSDPAVAAAGAEMSVDALAANAEREANDLLAQGQTEAAKVKFAEVQRLQDQVQGGLVVPIPPDSTAPVDPALQPIVDAPEAQPEPVADLAQPGQPDLISDPEQPGTAHVVPEVKPGESLLEQAKGLLASGNYPAAKQSAVQARDGGFGVEAKANDLLGQIALTEQAGALSLYEAALDAIRKGDAARARALLTELTSADLDDSMAQKVQDLLTNKLPRDTSGKALVGATETDAEAVAAQKLNAEVGTKVAEARRLMETDPEKAITLLESTLESIKLATLPAPVLKTMTRRVEVAIELAKKDKVGFDTKMQDKEYRSEIEKKRLRILEADKAKKTQIAGLMEKARDAMNQGRYEDAEISAKKAGEIDPDNVAAVAFVTLARTKRHYETALRNRDGQNESNLMAWEDVDAASVVPKDIFKRDISYRDGWDALTKSRRELAERLRPKRDPKELAILAKLDEPITLNIVKQPLSEAVDFLRNYSGLNVVLDPAALAEEGLTEASPVTLVVTDMKTKYALKLLLAPLHLTYRVDNEALLLTNQSASRSTLIVESYGVADLVVPVRPPTGPDGNPSPFPVSNVTGQTQTNPNAPLGPDGNPLPNSTNGQWSVNNGSHNNVTPEMFAPLVQLIKATIAPGSWKNSNGMAPAGGAYGLGAGLGGDDADAAADTAVGSITPFFLNISLIIRHTAEVHDDVVDLLRQLRRLQDLQVSVEVRFITVSDSFFEQIGVDFDFSIQSDVAGRKSTFAQVNPAAALGSTTTTGGGGTAGGTTAASPFIVNPNRDHSLGNRQPLVVGASGQGIGSFTPDLQIPFSQGSASAIAPFNALTGNTGATFGIAFLSDLEVYLFLTAVQGDTRSNLVQAPKVTSFNGAPAFVMNTTNRNFVANLTPIVANGAVAFQPTISSIPDGVTLSVTPVVSADRRYVRMTLSPNFITFVQFDTFVIPAAVSGFLGGAGTVNAQVQLPVISQTLISTTVTVPDGGTVLLGGVKRLREERREFGVPILAKTPLINRLFRNIGIGRTTDSLMIMVTPRIIILEEEEERLGIPTVPTTPF